jgi:hypothetical protein
MSLDLDFDKVFEKLIFSISPSVENIAETKEFLNILLQSNFNSPINSSPSAFDVYGLSNDIYIY